MSLIELEQKHIRPLTRAEKWQLIRDIQEMLQREEQVEDESTLREIFKPGMVYEIATASVSPDGGDSRAVDQLRKLADKTL